MGDNVQIVEDVTPNTESLDLSPVLDILGEMSQQQMEIIEQNKILIDYFVPTEEELLQQEKDLQNQQEEDLKALEKEEEEKVSQHEYQLSYDQEVLNQLTLLNENISKVDYNTQTTYSYSYVLTFGLLFTLVIFLIYKTIKRFIY